MHKGLTFYICFGKYGGFGFNKDGDSFRVCLGWVSFCVLFFDIESLLLSLAGVKEWTK